MRIPILTFGAIASIIAISSVVADTTVTSKQYVDTTRQATIPAAGTNYDENGGGVSVVTYTEDAGVLGERWICDAELYGDDDCDYNNLVTLDLLQSATDNLPETTVTYKTCVEWNSSIHTDSSCILWELSEKRVLGQSCSPDRLCPSGYCCGGDGICFNGPGCML